MEQDGGDEKGFCLFEDAVLILRLVVHDYRIMRWLRSLSTVQCVQVSQAILIWGQRSRVLVNLKVTIN